MRFVTASKGITSFTPLTARFYRNNAEWSMAGYTQGTFFNVTQLDDVDFNQWDEVKALNENAKTSVLIGFTFDPTDPFRIRSQTARPFSSATRASFSQALPIRKKPRLPR